ncbi:hypothetical protein DSO57_1009168 [Entomophthora muscae]|uniref:Uncharacterized protein n=1 Tax=Entomophthora muscae TaxID=34485 RepID=A0ACC2T6N8_9FUNG|nr:hypothetical protein DSO57_1009168 [Entomophthora muscae]
MLVALAFVHNQMNNNKYKLVAPLAPLSVSKHPCSAPNCCSIPHLPADNVPSTGTSGKTPVVSLYSLEKRVLYKLSQELCVYIVDHPSVLNLLNSIGVCGRPGNDFKWSYP